MCDDECFVASYITPPYTEKCIKLKLIKPCNSFQNRVVERFSRSYQAEILDLYLFESLQQVRDITDEWLDIYHYERPHKALGEQTPMSYLEVV
ncbi:integrase core domain-containing protein [Pseudoalteromonas luteoviolacea]|uniref:integrase core domain-containing protein n=1 Tax=Pseudoalteromonas luteoviolacea TaxID=43657 RepID=UPI000691CA1B|nr:integrase core domain-containing protein [Pseudoalteromonas luteoviolacea]